MEGIVFKVALIAVLGIGAQWVAWRYNLPAIVLMSVAGIVAGPLTGVLDPYADFGDLLRPMIGVAVAVILFEGGLTLNFSELRETSRAVRRVVFPGVLFSWAGGAAAAHYIAGLSLEIAILFAGIMVVTGPTVILPLLRQAKLAPRPRSVLKWEGIINDPIGALLAVLVFEYLIYADQGRTISEIALWVATASVLAVGIGLAVSYVVIVSFKRGLVPEFLKAPITFTAILLCFETANLIEHETGLLAVTVFGMALANAKLASIAELRRFKEYVTVLFVSSVFVVLTATLTVDVLYAVDWGLIGFVAAMLLLVRPISIFASTIGSGLTWQERLLIGWIAPRGVVAVAISGFFGAELVAAGYEEGAQLIPLSFAMVFATVLAHGFSVRWVARQFDLTSHEKEGVLIVGASPVAIAFARFLKDVDVPVTIADTGWSRLKAARLADIPVYYGEILSEATEHHLDMQNVGALVALTDNEAYNSLVCTEFGPEIGRSRVFQLGREQSDDPHGVAFTRRGRAFFKSGMTLEELSEKYFSGWTFQKTKLSEQYDFQTYKDERPADMEILAVLKRSGALAFSVNTVRAEAGDTVISFAEPAAASQKSNESSSPA